MNLQTLTNDELISYLEPTADDTLREALQRLSVAEDNAQAWENVATQDAEVDSPEELGRILGDCADLKRDIDRILDTHNITDLDDLTDTLDGAHKYANVITDHGLYSPEELDNALAERDNHAN